MHVQTIPRVSAPMAPGCPKCWKLMSLKIVEPWTLLRGNQLDKFTFECEDCGYVSVRLVEENH